MSLQDCIIPGSNEVLDVTLTVGSVVITADKLQVGTAFYPALKATWSTSASSYVAGIQFEYGPSDLSYGVTRTTGQGISIGAWAATASVGPAKSYSVRWRAVGSGDNVFGPWSTPVTLTTPNVAQGTTYPPSATDPSTLSDWVERDGVYWNDTGRGVLWVRTSGAWVKVADIKITAPGSLLFQSDAAGAFTYTVDQGVTAVKILLWGSGGRGALGSWSKSGGSTYGYGAGGAGSLEFTHLVVAQGDVLAGVLGDPSQAYGTVRDSTLSGSYHGVTIHLSALGGLDSPGTGAGSGSSASGGTINNTGRNGGLTNIWDGGAGGTSTTDQTGPGAVGIAPGGGGAGGGGFAYPSGAIGRVQIFAA